MENQYLFLKTESAFFQYLTLYGGINKHSRTNYMSWLKFLSQDYPIDDTISDEYIDSIIESERLLLHTREIYTSERDLVNFKSALQKYQTFVHSDFHKMQEETILAEIEEVENDTFITNTERTAIIKSRVGQGEFREKLIAFWKGCSISGCQLTDILVASHIKPWRVANNQERLDTYNGLLLLPNFDKLFDKGYISFDIKGKIVFSNFFPESDRTLLQIKKDIHLVLVSDKHKPYLLYHNQNCLIQ